MSGTKIFFSSVVPSAWLVYVCPKYLLNEGVNCIPTYSNVFTSPENYMFKSQLYSPMLCSLKLAVADASTQLVGTEPRQGHSKIP